MATRLREAASVRFDDDSVTGTDDAIAQDARVHAADPVLSVVAHAAVSRRRRTNRRSSSTAPRTPTPRRARHRSRCARPGRIVDQSMPAMQTFSPALPGADRMALGTQPVDHLRRPQAQRLPHATVVLPCRLPVAVDPAVADDRPRRPAASARRLPTRTGPRPVPRACRRADTEGVEAAADVRSGDGSRRGLRGARPIRCRRCRRRARPCAPTGSA